MVLQLPPEPQYGTNNLTDLLPSAAAALGAENFSNVLNLPAASKYCIIMVDGLGHRLVKKHRGYVPFIGKAEMRWINAAYPTTTACSLSSLGTGRSPGAHGIIGYDVYDPKRDTVNNMLSGWDPTLNVKQWQPEPTVFSRLAETDIKPITVSMPRFRDSGLTQASLSGSDYRGGASMPARVRTAIEALNEPGSQLVYLYFDEVDVAGHRFGVDSSQWRETIEEVDLWVRKFVTGLNKTTAGSKTRVFLTADHGMLDVEEQWRVNLADYPELMQQVRTTAGDPRFLQFFLKDPDHALAFQETLRALWGNKAWVLTKAEVLDAGWFGAFEHGHQDRVGDVIVAADAPIAFFDTDRVGTRALSMVGQHASLTPVEREVPLYRLN